MPDRGLWGSLVATEAVARPPLLGQSWLHEQGRCQCGDICVAYVILASAQFETRRQMAVGEASLDFALFGSSPSQSRRRERSLRDDGP
jgi:hypothetical protein